MQHDVVHGGSRTGAFLVNRKTSIELQCKGHEPLRCIGGRGCGIPAAREATQHRVLPNLLHMSGSSESNVAVLSPREICLHAVKICKVLEVQLHVFLALILDGGKCELQAPTALSPAIKPPWWESQSVWTL